jgi:amino acid transporter
MSQQGKSTGGKLGTFAGVFTPSILTILGLILFRRMGYVVGAAGLGQALLILAVANAISILTSLSLSAIATNLKVKGGGDYFLISRSLGVGFGGSIGVVLFLAQSISVAFYLIGFGEALASLFPADGLVGPRVIAAAATLFLFVFAWLGSDWATKLQYAVMAALAAGLLSFFVGGLGDFSVETFNTNWLSGDGEGPGFWVLFALFFPAVTGFTQGVSMSGDLADPGKSLPRGTLSAVGVSIVVYIAAAVVFAGSMLGDDLTADYEAMSHVALWPVLITVGIGAATLSSALASFMGGPRILQALAADRVIPMLKPFAKGEGESSNPRRGVLFTLVIALVFIGLGGVDVIAPIVSMFFLMSYGMLNYATALEARAASPSFRPRFRFFHYRASLAGAGACLFVMLMIEPLASAVSVAFLFVVYHYVERRAGPARWADSRRDHAFQDVRRGLLSMADIPEAPRNWRPHILVFSDEPRRRDLLVRFAGWMEGGSGMTTVVRVLQGRGDAMSDACREARKEIETDLAARGLKAFALVVAAVDPDQGVRTLIQAHGLGPIKANTVLLNWLEQKVDPTAVSSFLYSRQLRAAGRLGVNVIVLDAKEEDWAAVENVEPWERRIDVWWFDDPTSHLMLLLAYLMTRTDRWSGAKIRLVAAASKRTQETVRAKITERMAEVRIDAEVEMVEKLDREAAVRLSRDASLIFVPLRTSRRRLVDPFGKPVEQLLADLPVVALVSAVEDIRLDAEPDTGEPGQAAMLLDELEEWLKRSKRAAKELGVAESLLAAARKSEDAAAAEAAQATITQAKRIAARTAKHVARLEAQLADLEHGETKPSDPSGNPSAGAQPPEDGPVKPPSP